MVRKKSSPITRKATKSRASSTPITKTSPAKLKSSMTNPTMKAITSISTESPEASANQLVNRSKEVTTMRSSKKANTKKLDTMKTVISLTKAMLIMANMERINMQETVLSMVKTTGSIRRVFWDIRRIADSTNIILTMCLFIIDDWLKKLNIRNIYL